ncbi:MAG TPA: hypothetical protein VGP68_16775 [Gemmataceae bacterium]|nr:hypothetical protein [Gemmataceae bacterium]
MSSTLDLSAFRYLRIQGDGACAGGFGTSISGNFAGDLIRYADPQFSSIKCDIADIYFQNSGGSGVHLEGTMGSTLQRCRIDSKDIGINSPSGFSLAIRDVGLYGLGAKTAPNSIGLQLWGNNFTLSNLDIVGWAEGARLCGMSGIVAGLRAEVNAIALRLGINPAGAKEILGRVLLTALSLEANDIGIISASLQACILQAAHIMGTTNAPSGQSQIGIVDRGSSSECLYQQISTSGDGFSEAAFAIEASDAFKTTTPVPTNEWRWCTAANSLPNKPAWQIDPASVPFTVFNFCNQQIKLPFPVGL